MKEDIKTQNEIELQKMLAEKRLALRDMRFNVAGSKIKNVREQRTTRRNIARILTEVNNRGK